jgi:lysophospholipase L1-like esterase
VYFDHLQPSQTQLTLDDPRQAAFVDAYRPAGYATRLRGIIETVRNGGADVVVFTWPTLLDSTMSSAALARVHYPHYTRSVDVLRRVYTGYQAVLRQVSADAGVQVIDIAALFDRRDKAALFKDTIHFSCEGHALVAGAVAGELGARLDDRTR